MEYTPGQAVEQLVLHVVHQAGGGGSLPLGLPGDVQAARSWFCFFSQDGHPLWWRLLYPLHGSCPGSCNGAQVIKAAGTAGQAPSSGWVLGQPFIANVVLSKA